MYLCMCIECLLMQVSIKKHFNKTWIFTDLNFEAEYQKEFIKILTWTARVVSDFGKHYSIFGCTFVKCVRPSLIMYIYFSLPAMLLLRKGHFFKFSLVFFFFNEKVMMVQWFKNLWKTSTVFVGSFKNSSTYLYVFCFWHKVLQRSDISEFFELTSLKVWQIYWLPK